MAASFGVSHAARDLHRVEDRLLSAQLQLRLRKETDPRGRGRLHITFERGGTALPGLLTDKGVLDLAAASAGQKTPLASVLGGSAAASGTTTFSLPDLSSLGLPDLSSIDPTYLIAGALVLGFAAVMFLRR